VDPFTPIRATTVHPLLVHATLGVVPVFLVAYAVAAARRSAHWSFAGDLAVWVGATATAGTVASGLVANALVPWPGGIGIWRWLHLGLGLASAVVYVALAGVRLRGSRRAVVASRRTLAAALGLALLLAGTGWIGGEVLVFHSGIAVAAAGQGALAPTIARTEAPPRDLEDAMGRLRAAWADGQTTFARMLVDRPSAEGYARVAAAARDLEVLAAWLETNGPEEIARHAHAPDGNTPELRNSVAEMARLLRDQAGALEEAARGQRWSPLTRSLESVTRACAGCHEGVRWPGERGEEAREH
jgi:hypothetical protein